MTECSWPQRPIRFQQVQLGLPHAPARAIHDCLSGQLRFFLVALFFLLFDLEAVFLYPWVIMYKGLLQAGHGLFALGEMGVFVFVLLVGFIYIWKKGGLEWQ